MDTRDDGHMLEHRLLVTEELERVQRMPAGEWTTRRGRRASWMRFDRQSTAKTRKGIAIGSTRAQVRKAYPKVITPIDEMWVRFSDDEMLMFVFDEKRRVEGMLLGPAMDPDDLEE